MLILLLLFKLSVSNVYEDKLEQDYASILADLCNNVDELIENNPFLESIQDYYVSRKNYRGTLTHNYSSSIIKFIALTEFEKIPTCLDWIAEITDIVDASNENEFSLYEHTEFSLNCENLQNEFKNNYIEKYISCFENYDKNVSVN